MNDADTLRLASRRAALYTAIRSGDALFAARAAARIRVPLAQLTVAELLRAREARRTLGRAIVKARLPRRVESPLVRGIAIPEPPGSRKRALLAALGVLAILLLFLGSGGPSGSEDSSAAPADEPLQQQTQPDQLLLVSRGRTVALAPVFVAVVPTATPAPTATATPAPQPTVAAAATSSGTARTASPRPTSTGSGGGSGGTGATGAGGGGNGGGSGGGGGGAGGGSGSGTGFPTPQPLPPVPPPGFGRFQIIVLDAFTNRPIPGACVIIGTPNCDPSQPHTDANGIWAVDIPATTLTTQWDIYFSKAGYVFERRHYGLSAGQTVRFTVLMRRGF